MIGTRLAERYELTGELGRGGMGMVYRAHDPVLDREVAVKLVPPMLLDGETEERFQREAQVVARMDHPAIVPIHDFGRHQGALFFIMPLVVGTTLRELIERRGLRLGETLYIAAQVAEALDYSHSRGVVHRDVKPENVMVTSERGSLRVRVMDFGLARDFKESRQTRSGAVVGSLAYMSPEQLASGELDHRSDLYSLGTVLYECLAGEPPFAGAMHSVIYRISNEHPQPLRRRGVEVDEELDELVLACLAKRPASRPASGKAVAESLSGHWRRLEESGRAARVALAPPLASRGGEGPPRYPLVGREAELIELQGRLNASLRGECQVVWIGGEAGLGKSRLLQELEDLARAWGIRALRGRFAQREGVAPFQGLCELVQDYFRAQETTSSTSAALPLSDLSADLVALFPVLSEIEALRPEPAAAPPPVALEEARRGGDSSYVHALLARVLGRLAGGEPVVLMLENLHFAESSVAALAHIVRHLAPTPTLVAATWRPSELGKRHPLRALLDAASDDPRAHTLLLEPLDRDAFALLVESLVGSTEVRRDLVERLFETTEGNPFFGQELVRSLIEAGSVSRDASGCWVLSGEIGLSTAALPATLQQAVARRLEGLADGERRVLGLASVLGRGFAYGDLEELAGEVADLEENVDALVAQEILLDEPGSRGERLLFASRILRNVLYEELSPRRRRSLHRRVAEALEQRYEGRLDRVCGQLFHHFLEGGEAPKTLRYALDVGHQAVATFCPEEALRAASQASRLIEDSRPAEICSAAVESELLEIAAVAHRALGELPQALDKAARSVEVLAEAGEDRRAAAAALVAAEIAWQGRRVDAARRWVEAGLGFARRGGASEVLRQILTLGATVANLAGEQDAARRYLEEAEQLPPAAARQAEPTGSPSPRPVTGGGEVHVPLHGRLETLDPVAVSSLESGEVVPNVFETLTRVDEQARVVPWLAASFRALSGGRAYHFRLRSEARFHDGGRLTAGDVRYSLERMLRAPGSDMQALLRPIRGAAALRRRGRAASGIKILSATELVIELERPLAFFPAILTHPSLGIVPEGATRFAGRWRDGTLGTGPFRVLDFVPGERLDLERNPEYWRPDRPRCGRLVFHFAVAPDDVRAGFDAGRLSLAGDLHPDDAEALRRDPRFAAGYRESPRLATYFLALNSRRGPFADPELRRAFAAAVELDSSLRETVGHLGVRAHGLIPPGLLGYEAPWRQPEAVAADRERLRGVSIKVAVNPAYTGPYAAFWSRLRGAFDALGMVLEERRAAPPEILALTRGGEVDLTALRWIADYPDSDNFAMGLLHSEDGVLARFCGSPSLDASLESARQESDPALRHALYREVEHAIARETLLIPLFHEQTYRFAHPDTRGLQVGLSVPEVRYEELWIER